MSKLNIKELRNKLTDMTFKANKLDRIIEDLKELLHKGRSTINEFEIRDIINKYSEKW